MKIFADLHIHSKYSRATSKNLSIEQLEKYARMKGLNLLGTGDFQHPKYRQEIEENLSEDGKGVLWTKNKFPFILSTEISLMYSQDGRRAVHLVVLSPNKKTADKIISYLGSKGRLDYDGRPIFGIAASDFVKDLKAIDDRIEIIPAHCLLPEEKVICNPDIKKISDVKIGDNVFTHTGEYKKVTQTFTRFYNGKIFKIQPYYFAEGIKVTEEHPFFGIKTIKNCLAIGGLCKPNSTAKGKHVCKKKHYEKYNPTWIMAKDLEVNDILLYPRVKKVEDKDSIKLSELLDAKDFIIKREFIFPREGRQEKGIKDIIDITPDFCRLIGYYLAEGYIIKKNNCLQFSFAKHEGDYINDVASLMKKCFGVNLAKKRERNGYELYFYSKALVRLFEKLFYKEDKPLRAFSKKIPQWALYLPLKKQVELFKGWWRGDCGVSVSELLIQQMKIICLRLGIVPSIYKITADKHRSYNCNINGRKIIASHDCFSLHNLSFYEDKFNLLLEPEFKKFITKLDRKHGWIDENYIYIPIKEIKTFDYKGEVYNLEVEEDNSYVTPAAIVHNCMTPWFGLFGSDSGFDSLKECFKEQTSNIYAVESGMSADPGMLWKLDEKVNIVSFSDSHSFWPWRLGREATIFDIPELSYDNIIKAIRTGAGLAGTIETPPEYGKYHFDGHRNCNFSCSPKETIKLKGICPICKRPLTIGVEYRIEKLAKHAEGFKPANAKKYYKLVPLHELIALAKSTSVSSKKCWEIYNKLIAEFENELNILLNVEKEKLAKIADDLLVSLILENREGKIAIKPGFDGQYGKLKLNSQESLSTFV